MDRDIDGSPTLIDNLDHLLVFGRSGWGCRGGREWHADQSSELTDTMIDMHDIITHLKLLEFLEGECHLTVPCLIRTETIAMIAVEYLMVGEDTEALVMVDEAPMKGCVDIIKR